MKRNRSEVLSEFGFLCLLGVFGLWEFGWLVWPQLGSIVNATDCVFLLFLIGGLLTRFLSAKSNTDEIDGDSHGTEGDHNIPPLPPIDIASELPAVAPAEEEEKYPRKKLFYTQDPGMLLLTAIGLLLVVINLA